MLRREAGPERTDMVVDMVGEAVADSEVHEEVTVVVVADLWALPLRLETGDAVRGQVPTVVVVASEAEEVGTRSFASRLYTRRCKVQTIKAVLLAGQEQALSLDNSVPPGPALSDYLPVDISKTGRYPIIHQIELRFTTVS